MELKTDAILKGPVWAEKPVSEDEVILMQKLAKEAAVEYGLIVEDNI